MAVTNISFERLEGRDYAIVKVTGVLDLQSADEVGDQLLKSIPLDFEGNIIIDLREADDRPRNEDADQIAERVFKARYLLRKPVAVLAPETPIDRSRKYFQATVER